MVNPLVFTDSMRPNISYFVQNDNTDEFDEVSASTFSDVSNKETPPYILNYVIVKSPEDKSLTVAMYDVHIENVTGSVLAALSQLIQSLGIEPLS